MIDLLLIINLRFFYRNKHRITPGNEPITSNQACKEIFNLRAFLNTFDDVEKECVRNSNILTELDVSNSVKNKQGIVFNCPFALHQRDGR